MPQVKFHMSKTNALGEQLVAEVAFNEAECDRPAILKAYLAPVLQLLDDRQLEMNLRVLGARKAIREMPPVVAMEVNQAIEMLYGQAPIPSEIQERIAEQVKDHQEFGTQRPKLEVIQGGKAGSKLDPEGE